MERKKIALGFVIIVFDQTAATRREGQRAMRKIPFNLVALLTCSLTVLSSPQALSQGSTKVWKVGVLWHASNLSEEQVMFGPFSEGMRDLGYVEGRNVVYDHTFVDENYARFEARAQELINHKVDVILASVAAAAMECNLAAT
jgi:hypothetical protein